MPYSNPASFRAQANFLRRQFLQDDQLPFTNVLTEEVIARALTTLNGWLDRIFSPLITLWSLHSVHGDPPVRYARKCVGVSVLRALGTTALARMSIRPKRATPGAKLLFPLPVLLGHLRLRLNEFEEIGVDLIGIRRWHAMRETLIGFQNRALR
jgi:hypothetical protein